jgi:peptidoglycan/xylan/chitin deacetylase (PgdA/CDA1 family)
MNMVRRSLSRPVRQIKRLVRSHLPPALILAYHRVAEIGSDPQLLCVTPSHFAEQLEVLCRRYHPLSLRGLRVRLPLNLWRPRSVALTFDDGYADNLQFAKPLLKRFAVPATVFVTAGQLNRAQEFWWDEMDRVLLATPTLPAELELRIGQEKHFWRLLPPSELSPVSGKDVARAGSAWNVLVGSEPTPRQRAYRDLTRLIRGADEAVRAQVIAQLVTWAGLESGGRPEHQTLDPAGVRSLAADGLVEIGAHTMTHPVLAGLSQQLQAAEIADGKRLLEETLGRPVVSFAYPFGSRGDYTDETVSLVKTAGFRCACANFPGLIRRGTDPYQLPRFLVRNWDGDEFARRLAEWFHE